MSMKNEKMNEESIQDKNWSEPRGHKTRDDGLVEPGAVGAMLPSVRPVCAVGVPANPQAESHPEEDGMEEFPLFEEDPDPLTAALEPEVQRVAALLVRSRGVNVFLVSDSRYLRSAVASQLVNATTWHDHVLWGRGIRYQESVYQPRQAHGTRGQRDDVLCIDWDDYLTMNKAGLTDAGQMVILIGSGRYVGLRKDHPGVTDCGVPVHLREPDLETLRLIASSEAMSLGTSHRGTYRPEALDTALRLAVGMQGPTADLMVGLMDSAGGLHSGSKVREVTAGDVILARDMLERRSSAPHTVSLEERLKAQVVGQDEAIHTVARVLDAAALYRGHTTRPVASFLLAGPSGTGKTLLARRLAAELYGSADRLVRFDLGEYKDLDDAQLRLIGASPIWRSSNGDGELTRALQAKPDAVYLFDELDKADPGIQGLFLPMLDDGRVTNGAGITLSLARAILVFTTNAGVDTHTPGGFSTDPQARESHVDLKLLKEQFTPEFLNRFDQVIDFHPLDMDAMTGIAKLKLREFTRMLTARGVTLTVSPQVPELITRMGHEPGMGARPLDRAIRQMIAAPLAQLLNQQPDMSSAHLGISPDDPTQISIQITKQADTEPEL